MKRNLSVAGALVAGMLLGLSLPRSVSVRAQEAQDAARLRQRHLELAAKAAQEKAEASEKFSKTMDDAANEKDPEKRERLLKLADIYRRLGEAAGIGWVQVYKVDTVHGNDYGETSFITERESVSFSCTTANGASACFVQHAREARIPFLRSFLSRN
jgi:hypothetical protein